MWAEETLGGGRGKEKIIIIVIIILLLFTINYLKHDFSHPSFPQGLKGVCVRVCVRYSGAAVCKR